MNPLILGMIAVALVGLAGKNQASGSSGIAFGLSALSQANSKLSSLQTQLNASNATAKGNLQVTNLVQSLLSNPNFTGSMLTQAQIQQIGTEIANNSFTPPPVPTLPASVNTILSLFSDVQNKKVLCTNPFCWTS